MFDYIIYLRGLKIKTNMYKNFETIQRNDSLSPFFSHLLSNFLFMDAYFD